MARGSAITPEQRSALEADILKRWGTASTRQIAADHGLSATTVRNVAAQIGMTSGDARTRTENATAQRKAEFEQLREELKIRFARAAIGAIDELEKGSVVAGIAFGQVVSGTAGRLSARDRRELLTAAAIGADKAKMLDQYEQGETDASDVAKVLRALTGRD